MAIDFTQLLGSAPQLFRDLPFLMNLAQLIFYSGLILTFGGFVMRAYHGYLRGWAAVLGRVVFGFLALVTGVGISWVFPRMSDVMMYQVIQALFLDILIGGGHRDGCPVPGPQAGLLPHLQREGHQGEDRRARGHGGGGQEGRA